MYYDSFSTMALYKSIYLLTYLCMLRIFFIPCPKRPRMVGPRMVYHGHGPNVRARNVRGPNVRSPLYGRRVTKISVSIAIALPVWFCPRCRRTITCAFIIRGPQVAAQYLLTVIQVEQHDPRFLQRLCFRFRRYFSKNKFQSKLLRAFLHLIAMLLW